MNKINRLWALGFFLLGIAFFVGCSSSSSPGVALTGIEVTPAAVPDGLPVDVEQSFTATGTFSNNTKRDITGEVSWSSSATGVATINASGVATGVAAGSTNITASMTGRTSNTIALNVINPTLLSLSVTPPTVPNKLQIQRTQAFTAEGVFDNNKSYDVTQLVDWNSSNQATATIAQTGVATAVAAGTTNITASTTTPAVTSNIVALEVANPNPVEVIIEPQTINPLPINRRQQFTALMKFDDNSLVDVTNNSTWTSSDPAVATVNTNPADGPLGLVTGIATGDAIITATDNTTALAKTANVTVNDATITAVSVAPSNPADLPAGYIQEFTATGTFTDGVTRKLNDPLSWAVSDSSIATFNKPGQSVEVLGLTPGVVDVSYIDLLADGKESGSSGSSKLTVTNAILNSITTNPNFNFQIPEGGQTSFSAIGSYSDGKSREITSQVLWESDDQSVVVFNSESGLMTASNSAANQNTNVRAKMQNTATPPVLISSADVNVSVVSATLQTLTINPQPGTVNVNETKQFTVNAAFSGGLIVDYTERVTWESDFPEGASVSNAEGTKGQVTGKIPGHVNITATDPETSTTTTLLVTVSQP